MAKMRALEVVSSFRPAMIIGSQHTPWLLEKVLPLFSFIVEQIAKAMAATSLEPPAKTAAYHSPEMVRQGA